MHIIMTISGPIRAMFMGSLLVGLLGLQTQCTPVNTTSCPYPTRNTTTQAGCVTSRHPHCVNGECGHRMSNWGWGLEREWGCVCDPGWGGPMCDTCCELQCNHGVCDVSRDGKTSHCVCPEDYMGDACDVLILAKNDTNSTCLSDPRPGDGSYCTGPKCRHGECNMYPYNSTEGEGIVRRCDCDAGWIGTKCDLCCDLACPNGTCALNDESEMHCWCNAGFMLGNGTTCELIPTDPPITVTVQVNITVPVPYDHTPEWVYWTIGGCIAIVGLALGVAVAVVRCLWRRGNPWALKLAWLLMADTKPDSDDKDYDVFLSYEAADLSWVVGTLHPWLQQHNFSFYVDYCSEPPGTNRAEAVLTAIQRSRRTLLVVSPSYCQAEWPRLQYTAAREEVLKIFKKGIHLQHAIVPVILEEVAPLANSDDMDIVLSDILQGSPRLLWPGTGATDRQVAQFWAHLTYRLPKYKTSSSNKPWFLWRWGRGKKYSVRQDDNVSEAGQNGEAYNMPELGTEERTNNENGSRETHVSHLSQDSGISVDG